MLLPISWTFYLVGTALVLGSWLNLVSPQLGWLGWVIAMIGWGTQFLPGVRKKSVADEIQNLQALRDSGSLTEEEFEIQKQRLLGGGMRW
jgi:hypothetical protein